MSNEQLTMNKWRVSARKMPLSLCTKVMQQMQHFCLKNVACNDTLGAKRYRIKKICFKLSTRPNLKIDNKLKTKRDKASIVSAIFRVNIRQLLILNFEF